MTTWLRNRRSCRSGESLTAQQTLQSWLRPSTLWCKVCHKCYITRCGGAFTPIEQEEIHTHSISTDPALSYIKGFSFQLPFHIGFQDHLCLLILC